MVAAARARGSYVVDSVCPLVTKVHHEVKVRAGKGYRIVYVGHEGHEEAVGTMAVAPDVDQPGRERRRGRCAARSSTSRSRCWPRPRCRTATGQASPTPSRRSTPALWTPGRSDLCFATTNRQSALMAMAAKCDAIVVIGSSNSSNTRALEKLAIEAGCPQVFRVNHAGELPDDLHGTIGVTAGASAPEELVDEVIALPRPPPRRRAGEGHRRGRVLPAAAQHPRAAGGDRSGCRGAARWIGRQSATMNDHEFAASDVLAALRVG